MPRFKQPIPLEKLAFDYLVNLVVEYCDEQSYEGSLSRFRKGVGEVKRHFREWMPDVMFAEFCRRFISEFYLGGVGWEKKRPLSHYEAALEIMMDEEIAGLTLEGEILHHVHPKHANRIRRLKIIDCTAMIEFNYYSLTISDFDLRDLTTIICPKMCSDLDLANIASYCSKLRELRIQGSSLVTDDGLCALQSCYGLRILNLSCCTGITDYGINELLSANVNLEEFNLGRCDTAFEAPCFDVLPRARSLVCPSVKRFALKCGEVTDEHLRSVVEIFPNLTRLEFHRPPEADLRILKDLENLAELDFSESFSFGFDNLEQLLTDIGRNVTVLNIDSIGITQNDVKFVFKVCRSIQRLAFNFSPRQVVEKLVIPSSRTLNTLKCAVMCGLVINADQERQHYVGIELGVMLALKSLTLRRFCGNEYYQNVESIILDHVKFPNLRELGGFSSYNNHLKRIERLVKSNNLDLSIRLQTGLL